MRTIKTNLLRQGSSPCPRIVVKQPSLHSSGKFVSSPVDQCDDTIFPDRTIFTLDNQLSAGVSLRDTHVNIPSDIGVDEFLDKVVDNFDDNTNN